VLKAAKKGHCNLLLEVHAWKSNHHALSYAPGKLFIADPQHIESDTVVQELDLDRLVRNDTRRRVERDCIPGHLNPGSRDVVVLQELPDRISAVNLKSVTGTAKFLQQTEIVKRRADKQQFHIEFLLCLLSHLIGPEKDPVRMVKEQGVLNS
jgi:hypothetical protein